MNIMQEISQGSAINAVVIDVDGVLTNGNLTIDHNGEKLFKQFHSRDIRAIRELVYNGFEVYIVSADEWEGSKHFADKVGAIFLPMRDKKLVLQTIQKPFIAIGDDCWDIPMLNDAEERYCPKDADWKVKQVKGIKILKTIGGGGVIAELIHHVLEPIKDFMEGGIVGEHGTAYISNENRSEAVIPLDQVKDLVKNLLNKTNYKK